MKDHHINIFYSEDDEGYIADIPDLKYCSAFGETLVESLQALALAKATCLAGKRLKRKGSQFPCQPSVRLLIGSSLRSHR